MTHNLSIKVNDIGCSSKALLKILLDGFWVKATNDYYVKVHVKSIEKIKSPLQDQDDYWMLTTSDGGMYRLLDINKTWWAHSKDIK